MSGTGSPAQPSRGGKGTAWVVGGLFVLAIVGVSNLGDDDRGEQVDRETSTPMPTVTVEQQADTVSPAPVAPEAPAAAAAVVPNVVGMNHQYAQDALQAAGFYLLREEDATGQGRMLIWDRNWQVVSQDPAGGASVSTATTITLRSKKSGE